LQTVRWLLGKLAITTLVQTTSHTPGAHAVFVADTNNRQDNAMGTKDNTSAGTVASDTSKDNLTQQNELRAALVAATLGILSLTLQAWWTGHTPAEQRVHDGPIAIACE
jgi:hypothetical protein